MTNTYQRPPLEVDAAEYIVEMAEGATVLCEAHMNALRLACEAAGVVVNIYQMPWDEAAIACQACHLAARSHPQIILPN